jgi:hypothetical protein
VPAQEAEFAGSLSEVIWGGVAGLDQPLGDAGSVEVQMLPSAAATHSWGEPQAIAPTG